MAAAAKSSSKRASTFEILTWPDEPPRPPSQTPLRPQATGGISSIMSGAGLTPEEAEALQNKKPNSVRKEKEMSGSGIFNLESDNLSTPLSVEKPKVRVHQPAGGVSQILFGEAAVVSPKKPTSIPEVAKQKELSGTLEVSIEETPSKKSTSTSKAKELVGSDIFGPPPEVKTRSCPRYLESSDIATPLRDLSLNPPRIPGSTLAAFGSEDLSLSSKKCNTHKVAELSGNNIFKEVSPHLVSDKSLSAAKRREITGSNIFADGKQVFREHFGGTRKPPGGESSLTLV
ncbi:hypothetical protein GOP47_0011406 [Adiantum capillus-veneris]|uniref:DUF4057 domain-containing protein n=1 Tax=Adiantum capillus-veneris TaxID=13818 RepID=A0A9D4USQ9_ADICA|nr:hypothetical protein GOP47_0011406 [Adiantum capillus-veneris]